MPLSRRLPGDARPVALDRVDGRGPHPGVGGEAEVVVGPEHDHRPAAEADRGADLAVELAVEGEQAQRLGRVVLLHAGGVAAWRRCPPRLGGFVSRDRSLIGASFTADDPGRSGLEAALPRLVPGPGVADVGRGRDGPDQGPVELGRGGPQGPEHVDEQDDPDPVGVVPGVVLVAVVEEQAASLLPVRPPRRRRGSRPRRPARAPAGPGGSAAPPATGPGARRCACRATGWRRTPSSARDRRPAAPPSSGTAAQLASDRKP